MKLNKVTDGSLFYKMLDTLGNTVQFMRGGLRKQGQASVYQGNVEHLVIVTIGKTMSDVTFGKKTQIDLASHEQYLDKLPVGDYLYDYVQRVVIYDFDASKILSESSWRLVPAFHDKGELFFFHKTKEVFRIYEQGVKVIAFLTCLLGNRFVFDNEVEMDAVEIVVAQTFHKLNIPYELYEEFIDEVVKNKEAIFNSVGSTLTVLPQKQLKTLREVVFPAFKHKIKGEKGNLDITVMSLSDIAENDIPMEYTQIDIPNSLVFKNKKSVINVFAYAGKIWIDTKNNISIKKFKKATGLRSFENRRFTQQIIRGA